MSTVARKRFVLGCVLALLIGAAIVLFVNRGPAATVAAGDGTGGAALSTSAGPFTIEGTATKPISPGVSTSLDLKLTNPHDIPMSVTDISVTVQQVSAPNSNVAHPCSVGDFTADQASSGRKITVAARSTSTLSDLGLARADQPHVGMLNRSVNQDGCKGASLTLAFTASGTLEN